MTSPHRIRVRVYYEDTDFSGPSITPHTSASWSAAAPNCCGSSASPRARCCPAAAGAPVFFVVRAMEVDFRRPATMDDSLDIETFIAAIGGASIDMTQAVVRNGETLVSAKVKVVCVEGGKAKRLPPDVRARFEQAPQSPEAQTH